jgi:hypothetical protein
MGHGMARESLYGETILWSGHSKAVTVPVVYKITSVVAAIVSFVTLCYAIVFALALRVPVGGMIAFAAWLALIAVGAWRVPLWWRAQVEYIVTDKHVIWRRGRLRRSIEIASISYALIRWSTSDATVGDLVLTRAVPTGALRRTLSLTLADVMAPDRLWAIVRGVTPSAPLGDGERPLAQRLDEGERVLWSAIPLASPWTPRRAATAAIGLMVSGAFINALAKSIPSLAKVLRLHTLTTSMFGVLVAGAALGLLLLLAVAIAVGYAALWRPMRLARATRYFVTNARVLIRRGNEELHLDRSRIAYVIDAPLGGAAPDDAGGLHDVFLVLDGPQARAMATSGAFGGDESGVLRPVFSAIVDAETVNGILAESAPLRKAA